MYTGTQAQFGTGKIVIHHAAKGMYHSGRHVHNLVNKLAGYYVRNPHKIIDHGQAVISYGGMAGKAAITGGMHIGKMAWTHGPTVAKHAAKFMSKAAIRGFKLFT